MNRVANSRKKAANIVRDGNPARRGGTRPEKPTSSWLYSLSKPWQTMDRDVPNPGFLRIEHVQIDARSAGSDRRQRDQGIGAMV